MPNRKSVFLAILLLCCVLPLTASAADVRSRLIQSLPMPAAPLDIATSADGQYTFILSEGGSIMVLVNGNQQGTIQAGATATGLEVAPNGEALFVLDRQSKTVQVLALAYVVDINTSGSPFKGEADAPVTVAVFSDFQ